MGSGHVESVRFDAPAPVLRNGTACMEHRQSVRCGACDQPCNGCIRSIRTESKSQTSQASAPPAHHAGAIQDLPVCHHSGQSGAADVADHHFQKRLPKSIPGLPQRKHAQPDTPGSAKFRCIGILYFICHVCAQCRHLCVPHRPAFWRCIPLGTLAKLVDVPCRNHCIGVGETRGADVHWRCFSGGQRNEQLPVYHRCFRHFAELDLGSRQRVHCLRAFRNDLRSTVYYVWYNRPALRISFVERSHCSQQFFGYS